MANPHGYLYRILRIAFSAACGIAFVMLVVLWVRSYFFEDRASGHVSSVGIRFYSSRGWIVCFKNNAIVAGQYPWSISLDSEYWLSPSDARLGFSSPADFFGSSATLHISLPHGLVILVAAGVGFLPWIRWRFSLRALLIAVTLIAAMLGLIVASMR